MEYFDIALYRLREPKRLMPSNGNTIYECYPDNTDPYGIRVKFKPMAYHTNSCFKVHVKVDGESLGHVAFTFLRPPASGADAPGMAHPAP